MSGRHEPPTKRSFYLSLGISTLRFAIIVALVAGGVVVIGQAFPGGEGALPDGGGITASPTPSATPSKPPKEEGPEAQVEGVIVGVFNGTSVSFLAATTARKLETKFGYLAGQVADAPSPVATTTLYYRTASDKVEAEYMARHFFRGLEVEIARLQAGSDVLKDVQVAVYLGTDYAGTQQ